MNALTKTTPMSASMDSKEFAALFEKDHGNVLRDMRTTLIGLYADAYLDHHCPATVGERRSEYIRRNGDAIFRAVFEDESIWKHPPVPGVTWSRDARGYLRRIAFDRHHTLTFASGYDVKLRDRIVRRLEQLEQKLAAPTAIPYTTGRGDTLTKDEQDELRALLTDGVEKLPKDMQANAMRQGWSKLIAHFKVEGYRKIPRAEFREALSIIGRHLASLEAKVPALPAPAPKPDQLTQALDSMNLLAGSVADLTATVMTLVTQQRDPPHQAGKVEGLTAPTVSPSSEKRAAPTAQNS